MALLIDNKNDLNFNWHPGCHYVGIPGQLYQFGPIGFTTSEDAANAKKKWSKPPIPSSIQLTINLKNGSPELWQSITSTLNEMKKHEQIEVEFNNPQIIRTKLNPKSEHVDEIKKIDAHNETIRDKLSKLIELLNEYATVDGDELWRAIQPKYQIIPNDYYIFDETIVYPTITVRCKTGTTVYDTLLKNNILEEVYPKWYAEGTF